MSDRLEKLESELAAMRPCALPKQLERRIGNAIESNASGKWADRSLLSAMAMGAMAACVIVSVLLRGGSMNGSPSAANIIGDVRARGSFPLVMARADWPTDDLK